MAECFLVLWVDETPQKLSVMLRKDIVDGSMRLASGLNLIDKIMKFKWQREQHRGKIIQFGPKAEMQDVLKVESLKLSTNSNLIPTNPQGSVEPTATEGGTNKRARIQAVLAKTTGVRQNLEPSFEAAAAIEKVKKDLHGERLLHEELKGKYNDLLTELESLKEEHRQCSSRESTEIGHDVYVNSSTIATIKAISSSLNVFGRNLFRSVFTTDEIVGRSLMGKRCNANVQRDMLPSIDPGKRDAVIDYSLKTYNKQPGTELYKYAKKDLKHSLASLLLEMNKDANRMEQEIQD